MESDEEGLPYPFPDFRGPLAHLSRPITPHELELNHAALTATLNERERCAKIAEAYGRKPDYCVITGHDIAAAIRSGK